MQGENTEVKSFSGSLPGELAEIRQRLGLIEEGQKKIHHELLIISVMSVVRLFIILVPIILATIYLPRFFHDFLAIFAPAGQTMDFKGLLERFREVLMP